MRPIEKGHLTLSPNTPRQRSRTSNAPLASTGGRTVVAIGDIHGRLDLLDRLIDQIKAKLTLSKRGTRPVLIFLGDYVDRGASSKGVIDRVIGLAAEADFEVRAMKGNHEEALLTFLQDVGSGPAWIEHGGAQTLRSYGVNPPMLRADDEAWARARAAFTEALPPEHLGFLSSLELSVVCGDYVFVHAGVRPSAPLSAQVEHDLLWIRQDFLTASGPFEKIVVHGHSPELEPFLGQHRIGIDTGAYATGVLTAVLLEDTERTVIQAKI